jgi:hypothetical protein
MCARESHGTTLSSLEILWISNARMHSSLLICREVLRGVDNEWANHVDIASVQGGNLLTELDFRS